MTEQVVMANVRVSSFVKKGKSVGYQIPGTKAGIQNSQLLVSSGISSFDSNIGGGLPVGSLIIVDEDLRGTFSKIFMKYFLAEGLLSNQGVYIGSKDLDPESFVNELPSPVASERSDGDSENIKDEEMTIAWRYQNMKIGPTHNINTQYIGHYFDLTKSNPHLKTNSEVSLWFDDNDSGNGSFEESDFARLFKSIKERLTQGRYLITEKTNERKILRIGLLHIGSPIWSTTENFLPRFLYMLRALLRNSFATCMVTIPLHLFENKSLKSECVHLSDICIQLESFSGTPLEGNPALVDYNGFFRIVKWAAINGLISGGSHFVDLAIKLRRKKLTIEKLHLPPELEDTNEREQGECGSTACDSSKSKLLEF